MRSQACGTTAMFEDCAHSMLLSVFVKGRQASVGFWFKFTCLSKYSQPEWPEFIDFPVISDHLSLSIRATRAIFLHVDLLRTLWSEFCFRVHFRSFRTIPVDATSGQACSPRLRIMANGTMYFRVQSIPIYPRCSERASNSGRGDLPAISPC